MTDVSILTDARLFAAEDGLRTMYSVRKDASADTSDIEAAFAKLTEEMARRELVWEPLAKGKATDPKHFGDDEDDDEDDTNDDRADDDGDGGLTPGDTGQGSGDTKQSRKSPAPQKPDGPVVKKGSGAMGGNSGPPVTGENASDEQMPWRKRGTKSGKGGEGSGPAKRTQVADGAKGTVDGSNKTFPDDGLRQKGKTKSGRGGQAGENSYPGRLVKSAKQYRKTIRAGLWAPHFPDLEKAVTPADGMSHAFSPVRNICRICKQPIEDHVSKALGYDGSMFKAIADDSVEDRKQGADAGLALPDGSFYIPDEAHLHQAIRLVAQAPDPQSAMNHIIERAQAMGLEYSLPPAWRAATAAGQPQQSAVQPGANSMGPDGKPSVQPGMPPNQQPKTAPGAGGIPPKKPGNILKRLARAMSKAADLGQFDESEFIAELNLHLDDNYEYAVLKATTEQRYTFGPVYMPNTYDAHSEWTTPEDLQKSVWDYVKQTGADRRVYLQHSAQPAGEWVEICTWPQEVTARMIKTIDGVQKAAETTFPAGTAYMGVRWEPWAYEDVRNGRISGFSMGGYARRVEAAI